MNSFYEIYGSTCSDIRITVWWWTDTMSQSLAKWPWPRPTFRLAFTSQNNIHFIVCLLGLHGTFWLLAGILFVIIPFIYLYVPEAKDVDLNNIDEFFKPVETKFYVEFPLNESGLPGSLESSHRIQMIQNSFGTTGTLLNDGTRQLFAEGFLIKRNGERSKRRHFFLFNDTLVWGSVIKENINYIRQRIIRLNGLEIENIKQSNCWKVVTSGILNSVFFEDWNEIFCRRILYLGGQLWRGEVQMDAFDPLRPVQAWEQSSYRDGGGKIFRKENWLSHPCHGEDLTKIK